MKYTIQWTKVYTQTGIMVVDADSRQAALDAADAVVGDCDGGSMQWQAVETEFEITGVTA